MRSPVNVQPNRKSELLTVEATTPGMALRKFGVPFHRNLEERANKTLEKMMPGQVTKAQFDARLQEVLRLYLDENLSLSNIADTLGVSVRTVSRYIQRAMSLGVPEKIVNLRPIILDMLESAFLSLAHLAELLGDRDFMKGDGGKAAAIAFGILSDKLQIWGDSIVEWGLEAPETMESMQVMSHEVTGSASDESKRSSIGSPRFDPPR